jgi:uncharacterized caspase-like protein
MHQLLKILLPFLAILAGVSLPQAGAAASERRLALVIGNASYKAKALATAVNDAALVARTLQAAGFDVMGARDLDGNLLRQTFRDFTDRITNAGPDTVAVVYFAGYGLQFEGENYLVPTDADSKASDVPVRAVRVSEQMHALAALHLKESFIILDMARAGPFVLPDMAGGLAWIEPEANMLIAFNAAPGTVAPDVGEGYGPYAKALAEMIREGDLTPANLFDRVRLRVNELTRGAQVPWDASNIETEFKFFGRAPGAPLRTDSSERTFWMRFQPMRSIGVRDAYFVALMRDTLDAYADFLADYGHDPMSTRVQALLAARREAFTWRRTYQANVPEAYWSYMERYPRGPHRADAGRLLKRLGASIAPPTNFARMDYDVPLPPPDELEYIERSVLVFDDPAFAFEQPQETPIYILAKLPREFLELKPTAAPSQGYVLPTSSFAQLPPFVHIPADVAEPKAQLLNSAQDIANVTPAKNRETYKDERETSLSISSRKVENADPRGGINLPASIAVRALPPDSQNPAPPTGVEPIKLPSAPPLKTATSMPGGSIENKTRTSTGAELPNATIEVEPPIPAPARLAPPLNGPPLGAWSSDILLWHSSGSPVPASRSLALARSQSGHSLQPPAFTGPSPEATSSIPASMSQLIASAPPSTGPLFGPSNSDMLLWGWSASAVPVSRSFALAGSQIGQSAQSSGSLMPLPETTGSIRTSIPQSAPPSTGVVSDAWRNKIRRTTGTDLLPVARSGALAQSGTRRPRRTPGSTILSTETNSRIRPSTSRSVAPALRSTDSKSKPIAQTASTPPPR